MTQAVRSLSYTSISSLLRCPKSWYFHYILKTPTPLPIRMIAGRVYHHCLSVAAGRKQLFGELISDEEIADTFATQWQKELAGKLVYDEEGEEKVEATIIDYDTDPKELKDSGIQLAQLYIKEILPKLKIVAIEKRLTCEVGEGIPFVGYVDLLINLNGVEAVVDHKLARRKLPQADADKDLQVSAYAMLLGKPITGQFHQALDTKVKSIHIVETRRGQEDIERTKELVQDCWGIIQNGIFPRNETWWGCGPNCAYYLDCFHPDF